MTSTLSAWAAQLGLVPERIEDGYVYAGDVRAPVVLPPGEWSGVRCLSSAVRIYCRKDRCALLFLTSLGDGTAAHVELRCYRMATPYNAQVAQLRRAGGGR